MNSDRRTALCQQLARGRRQLQSRALWLGVSPWLLALVMWNLSPAASAPWTRWIAGVLLAGMVLLGPLSALRALRARRGWAGLWDAGTDGEDRVVTARFVLSESNPAAMACEFIDTCRLPELRASELLPFPWRWTAALLAPLLFMALLPAAPSSRYPRAQGDPGQGSARQMSLAQTSIAQRESLQPSVSATAAARAELEQVRGRATARAEAVALLAGSDATRDVAEWLADGGQFEGTTPSRQLSGTERELLGRAGRALARTHPQVTEWLQRFGAGDMRPSPALARPQDDWRAAQAWLEKVTGTDGLVADHRDRERASGGSDRHLPTGSSPHQRRPGEQPTPESTAPTETLDIVGRSQVGSPRRSETLQEFRGRFDPNWLELAASPEVESRWLRVIDRYRHRATITETSETP